MHPKPPLLTKHTYKRHLNYPTNCRFGEPGAAIYQTRPQPVLQTVPALKHRWKTSSKDSGRCYTASGLSQWVWDRLQLYWFLQLSNYSILPCIFQGNSVFCTIMLLFCKAILLWQHWWFWFFSKSRWLVSKGLSDTMIVIEIKFKIIFKAISHWKQFCF